MAFLTTTDTTSTDLRTRSRWTLGRNRADIQIPDNTVSKQHAEIYWDENTLKIIDCGSRNGTFVNHKKVIQPVALQNGDQIRVGKTNLYIEQLENSAPTIELARNDVTEINVQHVTTTVAFLDIVEYCRLSQSINNLDSLAYLLTQWLRESCQIALRYGAFETKTAGDSVMLVWIHHDKTKVKSEIGHVLSTITEIYQFTQTLLIQQKIGFDFNFKAGINTGRAVISNNGGSNPDFTPLGDAVNAAARFESATRIVGEGCDLLIGSATASHIPDIVQHFSRHQLCLKGFDRPHVLYGTSHAYLQRLTTPIL